MGPLPELDFLHKQAFLCYRPHDIDSVIKRCHVLNTSDFGVLMTDPNMLMMVLKKQSTYDSTAPAAVRCLIFGKGNQHSHLYAVPREQCLCSIYNPPYPMYSPVPHIIRVIDALIVITNILPHDLARKGDVHVVQYTSYPGTAENLRLISFSYR